MADVNPLAGVLDYQPDRIPMVSPAVQEALRNYIERGQPTGAALYGIITNAPITHVLLLDDDVFEHLPALLRFLYNDAPGRCHGSEGAMHLWIESGGLEGYLKRKTND